MNITRSQMDAIASKIRGAIQKLHDKKVKDLIDSELKKVEAHPAFKNLRKAVSAYQAMFPTQRDHGRYNALANVLSKDFARDVAKAQALHKHRISGDLYIAGSEVDAFTTLHAMDHDKITSDDLIKAGIAHFRKRYGL